MNFTDIIELAKQGYKPSDIKELLNLPVPDSVPEEGEQKTDDTEHPKDKPEGVQTEIADSTNINKDETQAKGNDDIEALKSEIAGLKASLREAQGKNTSKDVSGEVKAQETKDTDSINDWARSFM